MKKLLFSLLVCATEFAAQAQVTKLPDGFTSGKTVWMVRAGASLSTVTGDGVDAAKEDWKKNKWSGDVKRAFGGNVSMGFNKSFGTSQVYWGMELGVAMRGYKTQSNWSSSASSKISGGYDSHTKSQTETLNAFNAQLTPNIGYKFLLNDNMAIDVHIGGFASYDFAGKLKTESEDHVYITSKYGNNIKDTNNDSSTSIGDLKGYRSYDFGVIGGIGFWYGHFNIDLNYQRGFVSMFDSDNSFFCNKLQVRLGYAF